MSGLRKLRRAMRTKISTVPWIYVPLRRAMGYGDRLFDDRTELVIEGFPRSGNSFSEAAFLFAQGRDVPIGHHTHAAAHVIAAVRAGLPCLVVIREPVAAGRSLVMTDPVVFDPANTLDEYRVFHDAIARHREGYVLARFETVTTDYGEVVDVINTRFGTTFTRFEHTEANEAEAFHLLDRTSQSRGAGRAAEEDYSPHASEARKAARAAEQARVQAMFDAPALVPLRRAATKSYEDLVSTADV